VPLAAVMLFGLKVKVSLKATSMFMNPGVSGGAVAIEGAAAADEEDEVGDAGPGGGPYWAETTAQRARTDRAKRIATI